MRPPLSFRNLTEEGLLKIMAEIKKVRKAKLSEPGCDYNGPAVRLTDDELLQNFLECGVLTASDFQFEQSSVPWHLRMDRSDAGETTG
jgi:hypothetical protein